MLFCVGRASSWFSWRTLCVTGACRRRNSLTSSSRTSDRSWKQPAQSHSPNYSTATSKSNTRPSCKSNTRPSCKSNTRPSCKLLSHVYIVLYLHNNHPTWLVSWIFHLSRGSSDHPFHDLLFLKLSLTWANMLLCSCV